MLYHCGLLSERPEKDATLAWVRRGAWDLPGHPPEIEFERRVWTSMPGFTANYHVHTLRVSEPMLKRHLGRDYEELKDAIIENWLSCTREDALKLAWMRPPKGDIPALSQLAMLDDLKQGKTQTQVARDYRVSIATVLWLHRYGLRTRNLFVPEGFELIRS